MVNYFSLVNHQGRLFITPPTSEQDGLLLLIDLKDKNKPNQPVDVRFNMVGDAFITQANRYMVVCQDKKPGNVQWATFTSRAPHDQVLVVLKERKTIETHSLNGKLIDRFQNTHNTEIRGLEHNMVMMGHIATVSADACNIWSTSGSGTNSVSKLRSVYSKDGNHFVQARFTADGHSLVTLQKDGELQSFSLDPQHTLESTQLQIPSELKSAGLTCFEMGTSNLICSGSNLPYLFVKSLATQETFLYRLPSGCRGIDRLQLLRDQNLMAFLSAGYFYLLDLSYATTSNQSLPQIKLNLRIPHEHIKTFDIDQAMSSLVLGTNAGNVFVYDLGKGLENERTFAKRRIEMGVEEDLVVTKLQRATMKEVTVQIKSDKGAQIQAKCPVESEVSNTSGEENFEKYLPSFMNKEDQTQPMPEGMPIFTERSNGSVAFGGTQIQHPAMQRTSVLSSMKKPEIISHFKPLQSTASIVTVTQPQLPATADKQEYLNAGLSTAFISRGHNRTSVMQSNQVSIMKTIHSSVMTAGKMQAGGKGTRQGSVMSQFPVGSVMSQMAGPGAELYTIDENYEAEYKLSGSSSIQAQFNMQKVKGMLKQFGEYPEKYRFLTWKHLLGLPLNREAFQSLLRRGVHPAFKVLHRRFPITQNRLYNKLVRTLSALGNWCPVFAADNVDHLPQMVFPFIKVIPNDDLLVFEIVVALIVHYQQTWYEGYPAEPLVVLNAIEKILDIEDPKLLSHLRANAFTPQVYAWPIVTTLFTDVLPKADWLRLFDHLFTYRDDPELLIFYLAAFLICSRTTLLTQVNTLDDLAAFQGTPTGIPFSKLTTLALKLHQAHSSTVFTGNVQQALPMTVVDQYPLFTRYPEQVAASQIRIREKIIGEEEELARKHQMLEELRVKTEQVLANEERIRKQQEAASAAELERKRKLQQDQEAMLQERIRLEEITRLAKLEHIKKIEDALEQALTRQEQLRQEENKVAEEEFIQRQRQAKYEYEGRLQDETIANMEFKANQRLLEMLQKQQSEEAIRKMKSEFDARQREEEHRDRVLQERWRCEDQEQRLKSELIRQTLQQQTQQMQQMAERAQIEQRLREQELQKEVQLIMIEEQRRLRQLEEEQILRKQRFLEDMRSRNEEDFSGEQERLWAQLNEEKERERARGEARLRQLEEERARIEHQLVWERQEREKMEAMEHQQRIEQQQINMRRHLEEQDAERQLIMQKQQEFEREQQRQREAEQVRAQHEVKARLKESDNLMSMLRKTEHHINDIVDRGQNALHERKQNRAASSGVPSQYVSTANISGVNHSHHNATVMEHSSQYQQNQKLSHAEGLRMNYYGQQDKENVNSNIASYQQQQQQISYGQEKAFPVSAYPQHFQKSSALYSRSIGDEEEHDSSTSSAQSPDDSRNEEQSSLSSLSSHLGGKKEGYDSMLIEKHRQVKQEFEVYKQSFGQHTPNGPFKPSGPGVTATTNVFAYQPTGMTYVGGIPPQSMGVLQAQTISSGHHQYVDPTTGNPMMSIVSGGMPFRQQKSQMLNDSESYLSSSSSSGGDEQPEDPREEDDGTSMTSSQHFSGGEVLSQRHLMGGGSSQPVGFSAQRPPVLNYTGPTNPNQSSFSSSSSSQMSSSKPANYDLPLIKKVY